MAMILEVGTLKIHTYISPPGCCFHIARITEYTARIRTFLLHHCLLSTTFEYLPGPKTAKSVTGQQEGIVGLSEKDYHKNVEGKVHLL